MVVNMKYGYTSSSCLLDLFLSVCTAVVVVIVVGSGH